MLDEVRRFIRRERMLQEGEPVWVAVSGGIDSMVLLHVLRELGHPCSVAHVDHGLRGGESDADRVFVEGYSQEAGLPFRTLKADVKAHAHAHDLSIQLAGREMRYEWLGELWREQPMPIAMGHHADDAVESLFINLLRGTGVHGWSAIRPVSGIHVRPLLCAGRAEIARYAAEFRVPHREDASNTDPKYLRNRIRHDLMPRLEAMRPGALRTMARSMSLLRELEEAGQQMSIGALSGVVPSSDGTIHLPFALVEDSPIPNLVLHRMLRHLGFHPAMLDRIRDALAERNTGALFTAGAWQVCVDREALIISRAHTERPAHIIDPTLPQQAAGPFQWTLTEGAMAPPPGSAHDVVLDADRLSFPLELRPWRTGDRIRPIGMSGSKLVSDILIDAKVPMSEKAGVYVLVSEDTLVWVVGHRIAQSFQVTNGTKTALRIVRNG
jgi:tRNA(Ile)-lysidine synthase